MNAPDRFELFLLGDAKKVTSKEDNRTPNTMIFTLEKEDHTIGNLLRAAVLKHPEVTFAAYRVPHPLFANIELRIQTTGKISPKEALVDVIHQLLAKIASLKNNVTREFELKRMAQDDGGDMMV